ncbi:AI-2E family transporter [Paracoccus aurantiacus]|uniref:AI-2E family transporter n=1 Tax=Paracoccus aurantiacus TaxID=2599412 RepID=A0A5C6S1W5_9RHOB|nr:AI-2E family transporter [Paracoccus aurantiacus]TXB68579.1 AI-2E family transporter [Paracoccus aurantiacus]
MPLASDRPDTEQDRPHSGVHVDAETDPDAAEGAIKVSRGPVPLATILTVFAIAIALVVVWKLSFVMLMGFAGVLLAIALRNSAIFIARFTGIPPTVGVFLVLGLVLLAVAALIANAGPEIAQQMRQLINAIPKAWTQVTQWLSNSTIGNLLINQMSESGNVVRDGASASGASGPPAGTFNGIFGFVRGTLNAATGGIANLVLIVTVAIFLAINPGPYIQGALLLVPVPRRERAAAIVQELGDKLWSWLAGQALDMLVVATLSGLGLWLLGIPLALALGIIAGLTNVIPYIGPFLGGAPAVLFALTQGPRDAINVLVLFIVIQQLEGNVIMPLIQRRAAGLPPVMTIFGVIGFGVLFGLPGILVAAPLMVVAMVLVQRLYIEGVLGDDLPAHKPEKSDAA